MLDPSAHIDRLAYLEERFGAATSYVIFEPFAIDRTRSLWLQDAVKGIATFIGLKDTAFVVRISDNAAQAGSIELDGDDGSAFVEISRGTASSDARLLATIAHEVTHKLLTIRGVPVSDTAEYELVTDTAAVFFGFGKLLLNGCETERVCIDRSDRQVTTQYHVGYLSLEEVAFLHKLVCFMRGIGQTAAESHVHPKAVQALRQVGVNYSVYFRDELRTGTVDPKACELMEAEARDAQAKLADVDSLIRDVREAMRRSSALVSNVHRSIRSLRTSVERVRSSPDYDPCARYLKAIATETAIARHRDESQKQLDELARTADVYRKLLRSNRLARSEAERGRDADCKCPIDGAPAVLHPSYTGHEATCTTCQYRFVSTAPDAQERAETRGPGAGSSTKARLGSILGL